MSFIPQSFYHSISLLLLWLCCFSYDFAVGYKPEIRNREASVKNHAIFFAVDNYESPDILSLKNPIKDANEIARELRKNYDFDTRIIENPTLLEIEEEIKNLKKQYQSNRLNSEGQLLIFFSGHGEKDENIGYFLPSDANRDRLQATAFAYPLWRNKLSSVNCKHILVAIDACYSGRFDPDFGSKNLGSRYNEVSDEQKIIINYKNYTTRKFLTSGDDVKTPDESRFVYYFLEGLRTNRGLMTIHRLYPYLEKAVPTPILGHFINDEPSSNFLFIRSDYTPPHAG